jgi:hypothetical protein
MAATEKRIYKGTLGTSSATLNTVPASTLWIITEIFLANKTATDATATVTLGGTNMVPAKLIPANDALRIQCSTTAVAGEILAGLAGTASAIDCIISGVEVV